MKSTNNISKMIKHTILIVCGFLLVFTLLYYWFKGQSGGDIGLVMFSVIFLTVYTLIIGGLTYSWLLKDKIGVILGLLSSYLLAYILFKILLY